MAKAARSLYRCQNCGQGEAKWLGRCPACGEWNSLVEEVAPGGRLRSVEAARPVAITEVEETGSGQRLASGIAELDRVLGGGLVAGSLVLLAGEPGVGKSTLLVHALRGLCSGGGSAPVLYVSGEESIAQTAMRARRIGAAHPRLQLLAETELERILAGADQARPAVLAIDSIQTLRSESLESIPGSVGQVRECAGRLLGWAKAGGVPTILVGHVTKDGGIAGPKTLEHVVDAVLQFEGEGGSAYRVLRAAKNRFGSTQEIGVFEMRGAGMVEVPDPSALLLAERPLGAPGSVVVASAEGSRPILVEVQALVAPASAGVGRRTAAGVDGNRVSLLLAVLAQRAGCDVLARDVFVNVAGGVRLAEPAVDLGLACAVASSARGRAIDARTAVFGEVGLAGEVRAVPLAEVRIAEAAKLGFTRCILPEQNRSRLEGVPAGLDLLGVTSLRAALDLL
ncbi:MAG TPA: DNA repair protein RadA [Kofleriaceae bacterium]|nr:DNA repair protein RadA [Kofleriaceae bacterium]